MKKYELIEKMKLVKIYKKMKLKEHGQLINKSWNLYLESFPDGYATFIRDFDKKLFTEALVSSDYIKFILTNDLGDITSFALISNKKQCLVEASSIDTEMIKRKLPNIANHVYWIFVFMTKDRWKNVTSTVPLAGKMFQYIFNNNGVAGFSRDFDEVPTLKKQIKIACKLTLDIELEDQDIAHEVTTVMYLK